MSKQGVSADIIQNSQIQMLETFPLKQVVNEAGNSSHGISVIELWGLPLGWVGPNSDAGTYSVVLYVYLYFVLCTGQGGRAQQDFSLAWLEAA
jgi:hypothetical protein